MKVGDLIKCAPDVYGDENRVGIIISWLTANEKSHALWEVLYNDGEFGLIIPESLMEVISECR